MSKSNLTKALNSAKSIVVRRSPEILTGIGIAGMVATVVLAVKATPKAMTLLDDAEEEKYTRAIECDEEPAPLTPIEVVKVAWIPYVPAVVTGIVSIACILGASSVNFRRNAALATAYKLSETALSEYKEKVVETFGEKKEQIVREKIAEDKLQKNPVSKNEIIITNNGDTLCYDSVSGRYFKSSYDKIRKAENEVNRLMLRDNYISLNDLYDVLELDHTEIGTQVGWRIDRGMLNIELTSHVADDGSPALVMNFDVAPQYDYYSFS